MRIWRTTYRHPELGALLSWHPNRREAERALADHQAERGEPADGYEGVDLLVVPTDKSGLIGWLNAYLRESNG